MWKYTESERFVKTPNEKNVVNEEETGGFSLKDC